MPPAIRRNDTSRALTMAPGSTKLSSRSGAASARTPRPTELAENRENAATCCCLEARSRWGLVLGPSCWDAARDTLRVGAPGGPVWASLHVMHERSRSVCEGEASIYHVLALWAHMLITVEMPRCRSGSPVPAGPPAKAAAVDRMHAQCPGLCGQTQAPGRHACTAMKQMGPGMHGRTGRTSDSTRPETPRAHHLYNGCLQNGSRSRRFAAKQPQRIPASKA